MRPGASEFRFGLPGFGRGLKLLVIANLVAYVLELVVLRLGIDILELFALKPAKLFGSGWVWQGVTYWWLHDPTNPMHMVWNMFMLWMSGSLLESTWGTRRFLRAFVWCGLGGTALTLLVGAIGLWVWPAVFETVGTKAHLGASGAVMGILVAWGVEFKDRTFNMLLLGAVTGRTLVLIFVGIELLRALSFDSTSSTSHFGGMVVGYLLVRGGGAGLLPRWSLERKRKRIERELRVIEGGKSAPGMPEDPKKWN